MAATHGLAMSNKFMLGAASILLGPQTDLFNLTRASNSMGLVKNFRIETKPAFAELTQGVKNTTVYSVLNGHTATGSAEVYEYSFANLSVMAQAASVSVQATNLETTIPAATNGSSGSPVLTVTVTSGTGFAVGDWVIIQDPNFEDDAVARQISAIATNVITFSQNLQRPTVAGAVMRRMNFIPLASKANPPFYSAMVNGQLADGSEVTLALPKLRVTSGLTAQFQTNEYGNLPFEFSIMDLVPSDPNYATFGSTPAALLV